MSINKNAYHYFVPVYIIVVVCFSLAVFSVQSRYEAWILEGILLPTVVFVFLSLLAEIFARNIKELVIVAAFFLVAMNSIPGLRYELFYGCFDTPAHYRFTEQVVSLGHVPEDEFLSGSYGGNPAMHIFMACFSIMSGISVNEVFRLVIPALMGLAPLITYFATKNVLDDASQRYAVVASALPVIRGYVITGTVLSVIPYSLLIGVLLKHISTRTKTRTLFLIFAVLSLVLVASHTVTPLFVSSLLIGMLPIFSFFKAIKKKPSGLPSVSGLIVLCSLNVVLLWTWWTNMSPFYVNMFTDLLISLFEPATSVVPMRFYEVALLPQLQLLIVFHIANAVIGMLSVSGLSVFLRKAGKDELSREARTFYENVIAILVFVTVLLLIQLVSDFGAIEYSRIVVYSIPLCALLGGLTLQHLEKALTTIRAVRIRKLAFASLLFILALSCLVQFFPYQPLVPRANVLSESLPGDEYIIDLVAVNTVYQKEMISFAEKHSEHGRIASDGATRYQIHGFSSSSLFSRHIWFSPLISDPDRNLEWDLFLLHTSKAGPFQEGPEDRTEGKIFDLRLKAGNLVYENGESFIISGQRQP